MSSRAKTSRAFSRLLFGMAAILVGFTAIAHAGPPLLCHAIDIGPAKTLPWVDLNYHKGSGSYDLKNLTRDTLASLDSNDSVLVRMETLRRATIYARQDPQVAKDLLVRLRARADTTGPNQALAWFDVGYLAESYKQWFGIVKGQPNPAAGMDGYGWVKKAIEMRGQDPEMEFAAALITIMTGPENEHRLHASKAKAGATSDPLLVQNLTSALGEFRN
jgi:hypothetical protein